MSSTLSTASANPAAPPASAVSTATGLVGLVGLAAAVMALRAAEVSLAVAPLVCLAGTALPMIVWALLVEKVHRRASTGLNFAAPRPAGETLATTRVKLIGLYAVWAAIGTVYFAVRSYADPKFDLYFALLLAGIVPLVVLAALYVYLVDKHMRDPDDGLWHLGQWLLGRAADRAKVADQLRGWAIKGFFLAFMASILPLVVAPVAGAEAGRAFDDPVSAVRTLIAAMFLIDVCFGTVGYLLTLRPLDSHIRSANPHLLAWVAALACYPPFLLVGAAGPLNYTAGTQSWAAWLGGSDLALTVWGALLVACTLVYAWATLVFGMRFSNLTHRGILTNGPFRWVKHPAYLTKNLYWWLAFMPFLSTEGPVEALRNCLLLAAVSAVYWLRARTEERHLLGDPDYRAYSDWLAEHGLFARLRRVLSGPGWVRPEPAE